MDEMAGTENPGGNRGGWKNIKSTSQNPNAFFQRYDINHHQLKTFKIFEYYLTTINVNKMKKQKMYKYSTPNGATPFKVLFIVQGPDSWPQNLSEK